MTKVSLRNGEASVWYGEVLLRIDKGVTGQWRGGHAKWKGVTVE